MIIAGALLGVQAAVVVFSLSGYGIFANNPELLLRFDPEGKFFLWSFYGLAILNMLCGGLAVLWEAVLRNGHRALVPFALIYGITLAIELAGTTMGIPFGQYSYGSLLGPKWFGHVPVLVPLSWYTVAWPLWVLARRRLDGPRAILAASVLLVAWDLVLDPAMSKITSYWIWMRPGDYYGMPWTNLLGWVVTGILLFTVLAKCARTAEGSARFAFLVFVVNMALPYGFCVMQGYWLAVFGGTLGLAGAFWLRSSGERRHDGRLRRREERERRTAGTGDCESTGSKDPEGTVTAAFAALCSRPRAPLAVSCWLRGRSPFTWRTER